MLKKAAENKGPQTKQVKIHSYADKTKGKQKKTKENNVRLQFTFSATRAGNKPQILSLLTHLMEIANLVDKEAMIMP
jgi:hypothetical protein